MGSDFNGDGRDDILWRNPTSGALSNWLGRPDGGFAINDLYAFTHVGGPWEVYGIGDFDGDGRDDILWVNLTDNIISNWLGTPDGGFVVNDAAAETYAPESWSVIGVGDLDGDKRDDVLLSYDYNGATTIWFSEPDGGFKTGNGYNAFDPPHYIFKDSIADFDGDGWNEILWYNPASGEVGTYFLWGGEIIANQAVGPKASPGWQVAGTGDFNGDGRDDILWRHDQGALSNWLGTVDGSFIINDANAFAQVPVSWKVVGTGDYDGDGRDDILWRNVDTGDLSNWLGTSSGGFEINDDDAFFTVPLEWMVQPEPLGFGAWDY